jgi:hypothetical protein
MDKKSRIGTPLKLRNQTTITSPTILPLRTLMFSLTASCGVATYLVLNESIYKFTTYNPNCKQTILVLHVNLQKELRDTHDLY